MSMLMLGRIWQNRATCIKHKTIFRPLLWPVEKRQTVAGATEPITSYIDTLSSTNPSLPPPLYSLSLALFLSPLHLSPK
jgi:hypothetical protein